ncbi:MAG: protein-export chaperone SecB [Alphaproteobacteria bacterium]|nr:protein-export chaperone SecB [Alphaproteobacteria bacterium]
MADNNNSNNNQQQQYPFYIHDQYIKDLSFENPNVLLKYTDVKKQPEVSVNVETHVAKVQDDTYETTLKSVINSKIDDKPMFVVDITYGALVSVNNQVQGDNLETILLVHVPFLMFPFLRCIISDVTRNGGYPPLLIEPIDFASLYLQKKQNSGNSSTKEDNNINSDSQKTQTIN